MDKERLAANRISVQGNIRDVYKNTCLRINKRAKSTRQMAVGYVSKRDLLETGGRVTKLILKSILANNLFVDVNRNGQEANILFEVFYCLHFIDSEGWIKISLDDRSGLPAIFQTLKIDTILGDTQLGAPTAGDKSNVRFDAPRLNL